MSRTLCHKSLGTIAVILPLVMFHGESTAATGKCAMVATFPVTVVPVTNSSFLIPNMMATISFDTNTISYNMPIYSIPATYQAPWAVDAVSDVPFTIAAGPISGSQTITFTRRAISQNGFSLVEKVISMNIYPVNSGRTLLVQGQSIIFSGVCQY